VTTLIDSDKDHL